MQQELLSKPSKIVAMLNELGVRRRASLSTQEYQVFAMDLVRFELCDVDAGLMSLVDLKPNEFEGTFPGTFRLVEAVKMARALRVHSASNVWKACGECKDCKDPRNQVVMHGLVRTVDDAGNGFVRQTKAQCYQSWRTAHAV